MTKFFKRPLLEQASLGLVFLIVFYVVTLAVFGFVSLWNSEQWSWVLKVQAASIITLVLAVFVIGMVKELPKK